MSKTKELIFTMTKQNMSLFVNTLEELSKLDDKSLIRINKDNVLIYTIVGKDKTIAAFKSFIYETNELFNFSNFDETITFIVKDLKSMTMGCKMMLEFDGEINGKIYYDMISDVYYSDVINIRIGDKFKLNFTGGDPMSMNINITIDQIKKQSNIENSIFNFKLTNLDFNKIKKLTTPESTSDVYYLNTYNNNEKFYVSIGENSWNLTLSEVDFKGIKNTTFPKKYFKTISIEDESVIIYYFEGFLLLKNNNSTTLFSTEMSF